MKAPWMGDLRTEGIATIRDAGGQTVALTQYGEQARALAHRANAHPELLEALAAAEWWVGLYTGEGANGPDPEWFDAEATTAGENAERLRAILRAAIAKARQAVPHG